MLEFRLIVKVFLNRDFLLEIPSYKHENDSQFNFKQNSPKKDIIYDSQERTSYTF